MSKVVQPVILCGGSGTRLWPLSTTKIPKQFITLGEKGSLLEETIKRIKVLARELSVNGYKVNEIILLMHKDHVLPPALEKYKENVVYEPYANDTAVAIARSVIAIKNKTEDNPIMLILPADHYIGNVEAFCYDIVGGISNVKDDNIVLYGIEPTSVETKYGYIIPEPVEFVEKPNVSAAMELIKRRALWNSGIFVSRTETLFNNIKLSKYDIYDWITKPREGKSYSFDVAILQECKKIYCHYCLQWGWSDVGTWQSFMEIPEIKDEIAGDPTIITHKCKNINILNRKLKNVVVIGCNDLLIVANGNDLLIMPNKGDYSNELKDISSKLTTKSN